MKRVQVDTARAYSVVIGSGAVKVLEAEMHTVTKARRLMLVTDERVAPLHLETVTALLSPWEVHTHIFPAGEEHKSMDSILPLLSALLEKGFDRSDCIVALGGGVVGDMAGFAASIYMRGIDFVNIPTTLLSQVDSSVGGKTGVDLLGAKNIVGSFYQPRLVICDTDFLQTLPGSIFADGCAEVIKYAFIGDRELLDEIEQGIRPHLENVVYRCISDKGHIVSGDEFDRGLRGLLNFGHTLGHAIERLSGYAVSHGSAVAMGMLQMTRACERAGICEKGVYDRLLSLIRKNGLPEKHGYSPEELIEAARSDKKKSGGGVAAILPRGLCRCDIQKLSFEELYSMLKDDI